MTETIGHPLDAGFASSPPSSPTRSSGNAFYIVELWRHLVAGGVVTPSAAAGSSRSRGDGAIVPDSVREVVGARLSRLSAAAQRMIEMAAVAGQRVDLDVLAMALDVPADELDAPLDELVAAGLLTSMVRARLVYRVRARPRARHGRGERVASPARGAPTSPSPRRSRTPTSADRRPVLAELARHFAAAAPLAPVDKAVYYGRRAAAQAVRSAAYEEAASHLDAVLALGASDFQRAQALIELAAVRLRVGLNGPSRDHSREAFTLACAVGAPTSPPRQRCCSNSRRTCRGSPAAQPSNCSTRPST